MTRTLLTLLLLIFVQVPLEAAPRRRVARPSPPVASPAVVAAARQAAQGALQAGVPAVQIAVSQGGQVIYAEAFGTTAVDNEGPAAATPRSALRIDSITKEFTATAILRLAERGALSLDDRIEKFVPEFDPRGATITLRHLLNHTSGLRHDWYKLGGGFNPGEPFTRAQVVQTLNEAPFDFPPGQQWSDSNAGYVLLGYAIESITGKSFADFIHDEFALPLGLIDTGVCGTSNLPLPWGFGQLVFGWAHVGAWHTTVTLSAGSLCSTASDLVRWSHLLATGPVLLPASYATMITPALLENPAFAPNPYAFGVIPQAILGHPAVSSVGVANGSQSFLVYFSDRDLAVAVLATAFPAPAAGDPQSIAIAVAKAALAAE